MRFNLNSLELPHNRSLLEKLRSIGKSDDYYKLTKHSDYFRMWYDEIRDIKVKKHNMIYSVQIYTMIWLKLRLIYPDLRLDLVIATKKSCIS